MIYWPAKGDSIFGAHATVKTGFPSPAVGSVTSTTLAAATFFLLHMAFSSAQPIPSARRSPAA